MPKAGKCLHSHAEKVVFSYNLQRGKLASFWRNLAFVTTTAGKVHTIGKRKTQKKTAQTPSFRYRFNASKSVLAVQRFTLKQFSILLQTRFERDLPQKD